MRNKLNDNLRNLINYIDSLSDIPDVDISWRQYLQYAIDLDMFKEFTMNYYMLRDLWNEKVEEIKNKDINNETTEVMY